MTPSAATVKLMQALAYHTSLEAVTRAIQTPVAGELTVGRPPVPPSEPARRRRRAHTR